MKILALDLATTTGWALIDEGKNIISGSQSFKSNHFDGAGMRYLNFKKWLTELKFNSGGIDAVYYEMVAFSRGGVPAQIINGMTAILQTWCEHHRIPYQGVSVTKIKKFIAGKGNASKKEVIKAIQQKGHHPKDDNEADALALLYWVLDPKQG